MWCFAKGREHVGLCPFHDDHSPSFCVVTHKGNAFYKCHSCGAGGDAFDFVKNYHKMEFGKRCDSLPSPASLSNPGGNNRPANRPAQVHDLRKANAFAAAFFQRNLKDEQTGAVARDIIQQRGISDEMTRSYV